jgi:hypothetical protein
MGTGEVDALPEERAGARIGREDPPLNLAKKMPVLARDLSIGEAVRL